MRKNVKNDTSVIVRARITEITENEVVLSYKNKNMMKAHDIHVQKTKSPIKDISVGSWAHVKLDINDLHKGIITRYE